MLRRPDTLAPVAQTESPAASDRNVVRLHDTYDDEFFFVDTVECPISGTVFDYLRVRTKAVRPISRDSDFFVRYKGTDPALYSLLVCPRCAYTSYRDDFDDLTDEERVALRATAESRVVMVPRSLCGARTPEDNIVATDLALRCYGQRRPNERRRAVLLHRRAWSERERGDTTAELKYLASARAAYQSAFERDAGISDESAVRAAYLIGELWLRLGEPVEASRWLETAIRVPGAKNQSGLIRLARERLFDARKAYGEQRRAS